jgi:hypothetical protein
MPISQRDCYPGSPPKSNPPPGSGAERTTLQFSPAKEMAEVEQQVMKNMQAMKTG